MDVDNDANKGLYGKEITAVDIEKGLGSAPAAAEPLVSLLDKASPGRK